MPTAAPQLQFDNAPVTLLLAKRENTIDSIVELKNAGLRSQTAFLLLRLATSGDANYVAQGIPMSASAAGSMDKVLLDGALEIFNIDQQEVNAPLSGSRWFMPWREGGMGLASLWHSAEALFLSTWASALPRACEKHDSP